MCRTWTAVVVLLLTPSTIPAAQAPRASLSLRDALLIAREQHPELLAREADVSAAEGRRLEAGLFPNPEIFARMEAGRFSGNTAGDAEYMTGVAQPIPLGRRLGAARAAGEQDVTRTELRLEAAKIDIETTVRKAFADAVYQEQVLRAREHAVETARRALDVADARLSAGDAIPSEAAQARVEFQRAQLARDRAEHEYEEAMHALLTEIGTPDADPPALVYERLEQVPVAPPLDALLSKLDAHPAVAAALADAAMWEERARQAKEERKPDLRVEAAYRRIGPEDANAFDVGFSLPIPLFDRNQGDVQTARSEATAARRRAERIRHELSYRICVAHDRLQQSIRAAEFSRTEILPQYEGVLEVTEDRYRAGDISLSEVLPVRRDATAVQFEYLDAVNDLMHAWAELAPIVSME